jgi:hypothetical protein
LTVQAFGINLEDAFIGILRRFGIRRVSKTFLKLAAYVWVVVWLGYTTPAWVDWTVESGLWKKEIFHFSLSRMVLKYCGIESAAFNMY